MGRTFEKEYKGRVMKSEEEIREQIRILELKRVEKAEAILHAKSIKKHREIPFISLDKMVYAREIAALKWVLGERGGE